MNLQSEALQTALANTAPRTSENANSTFLSTETLGNLTCDEGWLYNIIFAFAISHISFLSLIFLNK